MYETNRHEKTCPLCKKEYYPENKVVHKVVCGDNEPCKPVEDDSADNDCKVVDFCSEKCASEYTAQLPKCEYTPAWKKYMGKINEMSKSSGVAGCRTHQLHKYNR